MPDTDLSKPVTWGILSTAKIGLDRVIGPMQKASNVQIAAIASRDLGKARVAAQHLNIRKAYGSYHELLCDPEIEAVYIPLPNDMHVEWAERAVTAGKHVLVEKPLGMNAAEAERLIAARDRTGKLIVEAFMVRYAAQWITTRQIIHSGRIGTVRALQAHVTYRNMDPGNIRNRVEVGGGGLMDIGCYLILFARLAFADEPRRVVALVDRDPEMGTDRHSSVLLDFRAGQATLFLSTQLARAQRVRIFGDQGSIEVQVPVNAPDDRPTHIVVDDGRDSVGAGAETFEFPPENQYTLQGEAVSRMIRESLPPAMPLEQSVANMRVLDAVFRSERSGGWEVVRQN